MIQNQIKHSSYGILAGSLEELGEVLRVRVHMFPDCCLKELELA